MRKLVTILSDIKVQHTIFALPFAIMSAFIAAGGVPDITTLVLIILALFFARAAAMAFNRLVDLPFDIENPRTRKRALAAGEVSTIAYMAFITGAGVGFIIICGLINVTALKLSPFALLIVFFYSYTKRITPYSHFFLGIALALAPIGAWVAITENISVTAIILGLSVVFWLAGLDTIYSCQDYQYDLKRDGLHSIPKRFGVKKALMLSALFHAVMVLLLVVVGFIADLSWFYWAGVLFTAAMLSYEHSLVRPDDLTRVNVAFFNVNGIISAGLMLFVIFDIVTLGT